MLNDVMCVFGLNNGAQETFYRVCLNILPTLRGVIKCLGSLLNERVSFGRGLRIGKGSKWLIHPGGRCFVGSGMKCGRFSTISILSKGYLEVGESAGIGDNNQIVCHGHIVIGESSLLGPNVMVYDHNHLHNLKTGVDRTHYDIGEVIIGKRCWIGAGSIILKDVHIGDNCIIGAGSVVTKDIPDNCVAVGNPARVIKTN